MLDAHLRSSEQSKPAPADSAGTPLVSHQRIKGAARVALELRRGRTALSGLRQQGSAKAMLPRVHTDIPEVVFLNTAGGLTGGDKLRYTLDLGAGASVVATTQTAERAYASLGNAAEMDVTLRAGPGASLVWIPQETILFEGSNLERRTQVDLQGDARLLMAETLVLGRTAMGERLDKVHLSDWRHVTRDGVPVLIEPLMLSADVLAHRDHPAVLGGALALSTIAVVEARAEDRLEAIRRVLETIDPAVEAAASGWDGKLILRLLSQDAFALRRAVARCLFELSGASLPRVWQV